MDRRRQHILPILGTILAVSMSATGFLLYHQAHNQKFSSLTQNPTTNNRSLTAAAAGSASSAIKVPSASTTSTTSNNNKNLSAEDFIAKAAQSFAEAHNVQDVQFLMTPDLQHTLEMVVHAGVPFAKMANVLKTAERKTLSKNMAEFTVTIDLMPGKTYHGTITVRKFSDNWKFSGFRLK